MGGVSSGVLRETTGEVKGMWSLELCDQTQEFRLLPEAASAATLLPAEIQDAGTATQICVCSTGEMVHFFTAKLVKLYSSIGESFSYTAKGRS